MMNKKISISITTKIALGIIGGFIFALVMIPVLFVLVIRPVSDEDADVLITDFDASEMEAIENFYITVYRSATSVFQTIELERYLIGVVAAEMPALFELDALRAQAVAARTYAVRILEHSDYILDTMMHQVFLDDDQLKARWQDDFDIHFKKIEEAVTSTRGIVLKYDDDLIAPMFFAMSNGATENSEDVFDAARPYLRSVSSIGYEDHASFAVSETFTLDELREAFDDITITTDNMMVLSYSEGGNIAQMMIGARTYTGREVREILGLRSAAFSISNRGRGITFTTYGHGHGVGMSQHGANVMALQGYDYVEILTHFYQNVTLVEKNFTNDE